MLVDGLGVFGVLESLLGFGGLLDDSEVLDDSGLLDDSEVLVDEDESDDAVEDDVPEVAFSRLSLR